MESNNRQQLQNELEPIRFADGVDTVGGMLLCLFIGLSIGDHVYATKIKDGWWLMWTGIIGMFAAMIVMILGNAYFYVIRITKRWLKSRFPKI